MAAGPFQRCCIRVLWRRMLPGILPGVRVNAAVGAVTCVLFVSLPAAAPGQQLLDSSCDVHLQSTDFVGPAADLARILDLQDTTSRASFVMLRAGRGHRANACAAPAAVTRLAQELGTRIPGDGLRLLPAELNILGNSAYPRDWNDGVLWGGRGVNAAFTAGVGFRWGPLTTAVAPVIAWHSNADFERRVNTDTSRSEFATSFWSGIDRPDRFGDGSFARLDPGQSFARLDAGGFGVGISNENIRWGPSRRTPLLLSGTSAGFAHAFIESGRPLDIWIGDLEFQLFWGRLDESDYFDNDRDNDHRLAAGLLLALQPRILDGLTIGAARVEALTWWPELTFEDLVLGPYRGLRENPAERGGDNQLISLFFRLATAPGGLEAYGEWAREDHWGEWIELLRNLDSSQAWTLGLQKVVRHGENALRIGLEVAHMTDGIPTAFTGRGFLAFYTHSSVTQGHSHRGQLLGAPLGSGGESVFAGGDYFWTGGRTSLSVERARYATDYYSVAFADRYGAQARDTELTLRAGHVLTVGAGLSLEGELGRSLRYNRAFLGLETLEPGQPYRREINWALRLGARWLPPGAR